MIDDGKVTNARKGSVPTPWPGPIHGNDNLLLAMLSISSKCWEVLWISIFMSLR
jgi:hypothetical protein